MLSDASRLVLWRLTPDTHLLLPSSVLFHGYPYAPLSSTSSSIYASFSDSYFLCVCFHTCVSSFFSSYSCFFFCSHMYLFFPSFSSYLLSFFFFLFLCLLISFIIIIIISITINLPSSFPFLVARLLFLSVHLHFSF